jgi:hypothetical protein
LHRGNQRSSGELSRQEGGQDGRIGGQHHRIMQSGVNKKFFFKTSLAGTPTIAATYHVAK